jgi:hypothetical protein
MQTRAQSTLEVVVDFVFSILVNVGGQRLIYGTTATATRVTFFSSIFLALVFARRFVTRRFFEALTSPGSRQSRSHSALEAVSDTALGFVIAVVLQLLIYGEAATLLRASLLTLGLYGLTMVRRYVIRRIFAALAERSSNLQGGDKGVPELAS